MTFGLAASLHAAEEAMTPPNSAMYKRADTNFYARGDVLRGDPTAVIVPPTSVAQNGDNYTFTPKKKAPKTIYIEVSTDWIEPITPPEGPGTLRIAPDAMQIREPQGDVQVALPSAPSNFAPATDGMALPNGAVVKTGTNATAAVLFGGVDSARLMPDSEAAVQQTVTATARTAEVDLTAGGVFSKVGTQVGVVGAYQVHTPFGSALAQGGDFAALIAAGRADVWISQGTVEMTQPDGRKLGVVAADGTGPLKLIRYPAIASAAASLQADAESLTQVYNFIPVANQKLAALHAKQAKGLPLTSNEQAYLGRIKQVPALIKLALVEPPAPPEPVTVLVRNNGTIRFSGETLGLAEFTAKIKTLAAAKPDQSVIVKASPKTDYAAFTAVVDACKAAPIKEVAVASPAPQPPPPAPIAPAAPAVPAAPTAPVVATPLPAAPPKPATIIVHDDGSIGFGGKRQSLAEFKPKLAAAVKAVPTREFIIKAAPTVDHAKIQAVLDACADAHVAHVTPPAAPLPVTAETPPAAPAPAVAATTGTSTPAPVPLVENDTPVPAQIQLAADGTLTLDGAPVSEDDLKAKLADLAQTHPKNPLVMLKQPKVTKAQWTHYVDLCHSLGLRLLVKNAKATPSAPAAAPATPAVPAQPARPAAAEGGGTTSMVPAPHLSLAPAAPSAVPVEIELADDGQVSFLGEVVTEEQLKLRLDGVWRTNPDEPVLITKDIAVTRAQWQHIVDLCHAARLKVRVQTRKPGDSASSTDGAATGSKILPLVIGVAADGTTTFEGQHVTLDDLQAKLDAVAKANPNQPIVVEKSPDAAAAMADPVVALCRGAHLPVRVKTAKSFLPPAPPQGANLPAPSPRMHPSLTMMGLPQ